MKYLNSLKLNGYNDYGCGTIAIHNALVWSKESISPRLEENLNKISKMIKEENHCSSVKNIRTALNKIKKKFEEVIEIEGFNFKDIKEHLKNGGSVILLSFEENENIGHYEFYRYENGILYESDIISSFIHLKRKMERKNKYKLTPEAWFIN